MPLGDTNSVLGITKMKASFVKVMKDGLKNNVIRSTYIPGAEGMDGDHESCGLGEIKRVEQYKYIPERAGDYFDAIVDHCDFIVDVGIYHNTSSIYFLLALGAI